ncbi:hypothetical protein [Ornithinimicrobium kibberense]|uniref:hypothetical protein n=1 Tax=Ornithinimicrobium kibberense TaxID=282060 RepID=UPI0036228D30
MPSTVTEIWVMRPPGGNRTSLSRPILPCRTFRRNTSDGPVPAMSEEDEATDPEEDEEGEEHEAHEVVLRRARRPVLRDPVVDRGGRRSPGVGAPLVVRGSHSTAPIRSSSVMVATARITRTTVMKAV